MRRLYLPKKHGQHRPRSIPPLTARARPAVYRHALPPVAETTADPNSSGFRPMRRGAAAIDQWFKVLRQQSSATGILEGDIQGFFEPIRFSWIDAHIPMNRRILSHWLRRGFRDRGPLLPTTAGVPHGGISAPTVSNLVWDGLETVVHGSSWPRRVHTINDVRWADDFIVTARSRQVLEAMVLPRINALLAARGVRLSPTKPVITPISQGFDFFGQRWRQHARPNATPATRQITPSRASLPALTAKVSALCKRTAGRTPAPLIETLKPILRGWATYHRQVSCGETCATRDNFVWRRLSRWASGRHSNNTGRWIAERYFPHQVGESWRFTDPGSGQHIIRVREAVTPPRHSKVKGDATPFDPAWEADFQHPERQLTRQASSPGRAKILRPQNGRCPVCRQGLPCEEDLARQHRDGHHQNTRLANLVFLHPTCHRQVHAAPDSRTGLPRSSRSVGHA